MPAFLPDERPYVIAEVGGNHGGDYETALEYVQAAAQANVDAVKFQIYRAERLIQPDEPPLPLAGDDYDTQFDRFKELEFTEEEWEGLIDAVDEHEMDFAASVFDPDWVEFLGDVSPFIKIASGDLTNVPLLRKVREQNKPIVLSTGFATMAEIERAVSELPTDRLVLLHCVGSYPTEEEDANLQMIETLDEKFDVPVGYSDHTIGNLASTAAMAKGSAVIEKHFTLNKSIDTGDHRLSADPEEMAELVENAHRLGRMSGSGDRTEIFECEKQIKNDMRRSVAVTADVEAGDELRPELLTALRPEDGISPLEYDEVLGATVARDLEAGSLLTKADLQ